MEKFNEGIEAQKVGKARTDCSYLPEDVYVDFPHAHPYGDWQDGYSTAQMGLVD